MTRSQLLGSTAFIAIAIGTVAQGTAYAQDTVRTVERIVVTAERRTQDLQTSAISATVLTEKMLEDKGVVNLTTLQYAAPGLMISDYGSANTFNIRGIGQSSVEIDLPSGVVIYRDGVPTLTGYFQNAPYYDMASVEVLRGPQGTFGGKSASAGAVFIRTRDPELDEIQNTLTGGVGNYGFYEWTGIFNRPIGDTLALRMAVHGERRDSLFDSISSNPNPGNDHYGGPFTGDDERRVDSIRGGLLWQITDAFKAVWKLDVDDLHFGSHAATGFIPTGPNAGVEEDMSNPIVNGPHKYVDRGQRSSLRLTYEFENGIEINSLSGYAFVKTRANWDFNGSNPAISAWLSGGKTTNFSQEFNVLSPDDQRFTWVVGLFGQSYRNDWYDGKGDGLDFSVDPFDDPPGTISSPWKKDEIWYAVFGEIAYDLTDQLKVKAGGRLGHYKFDQFTQWVLFEDPSIPLSQPVGGVLDHYEEDSFDWKVDLDYQLSDTQFLYALISRGHTDGTVNAFPNANTPVTGHHTPVNPMKVINYEVGWKGSFIDDQVSTQLNVYYQTFEDYQALFALTGLGIPVVDTFAEFKNARAESIIYGVELGVQAYFENWTFDLGFSYSKSELGSFGTVLNIFAPVYGGPPDIELDGARTPFAPEVTSNAGLAYTFLVGDQGEPTSVTPRIDVAYFSDSYASLFENRATFLEGQTLLSASVRVETGNWDVFFWGTNLTDERFATAKQSVTGAGGFIDGIVYRAPPRLIGLRVTRDF
jgi:iron complex outermembrane recepter protein